MFVFLDREGLNPVGQGCLNRCTLQSARGLVDVYVRRNLHSLQVLCSGGLKGMSARIGVRADLVFRIIILSKRSGIRNSMIISEYVVAKSLVDGITMQT